MLKSKNNFINLDFCSGCGLCEAAVPGVKMDFDDDGFSRPQNLDVSKLDTKTVDIISKSCPSGSLNGLADLPNYNLVWGPVRSVYRGYASCEKLRYVGSSGGVISALSSWALEKGGYDTIIQCKQDDQKPWRTKSVLVNTHSDIYHNAGSRYTPSSPVKMLDKLSEESRKILFIGKPCDIYAAKKYIEISDRFQSKSFVFCSFFCAGVPSENGGKELVRKSGFELDEVHTMRYRGFGWPGKNLISTKDGKSFTTDYETSWGSTLNRYLQDRCKLCADGTGEHADIIAADCWQQNEDGTPNFSESKGLSLIIVRTSDGEELLKKVSEDGFVKLDGYSINDIKSIQNHQYLRKSNLLIRLLGFRLAGASVPMFKNYGLFQLFIRNLSLNYFKVFFGAFKRGLLREKKP